MRDKRKGIWNLWRPLAIALILSVAILNLSSTSMHGLAAEMTTFKTEPATNTGSVGDFITLVFNAYDTDDLWGWQVYLTWDPTVLSYTSHTFGDILDGQPLGTVEYADTDYVDDGEFVFSIVSFGGDLGVTVDVGWLGNVTLEVLGFGETALQIDHTVTHGWTFWLDHTTECYGDDPDEMIKKDGVFFHFDFNEDGIIDIYDIAQVCILYGEPLTYTNDPTLWDLDAGDEWTAPEEAATSNDAYAYTASDGATETYGGYGFHAYPGDYTVEVGIECFQEDAGEWVKVRVSGDGGSTWGATHELTPLGTVDPDTPTWIDVSADLSWTGDMLTDTYFRAQIEYDKAGSAKKVFVDWLPVRVTYDPYADLNGDGAVDITDLSMIGMRFGERT